MSKNHKASGARPQRRSLVQLDGELAKLVRVVAGGLDMSVPEWVNARLYPIARQELTGVMEVMSRK